jgi:uncharacterized protein YndB with AHSA1/START domain
MPAIEKRLLIAAPVERVWEALSDPAAIQGWMGEDPDLRLDLRPGGRYLIFSGATSGEFTEVTAPRVLAYTWRQQEWPAAWPDSVVHWELTPSGAGTQVRLTHDQFPNAEERDSHASGWDDYWLTPMQAWLEDEAA